MGSGVLAVTIVGLLASAVLLLISVRAGRQPPSRRVLWIVALVALSASILFRVALLVGVLMNGSVTDALPLIVGNLAVAVALTAAFWRPGWAGWALIGSAVALPALDWLLHATATTGSLETSTVPAMLGFYGVPALVTGTLLVLSARGSETVRPN